jgi:hypothetical protein
VWGRLHPALCPPFFGSLIEDDELGRVNNPPQVSNLPHNALREP